MKTRHAHCRNRRRSFRKSGERHQREPLSIHARRLRLEVLENRLLLSGLFTVTNTSDSGTGSLRQAILDANANPGLDTIDFNIPGTGPHTIQPLSALPRITDPAVIDGYTQPGATPNTNPIGTGLNTVLMIELDGSRAGSTTISLSVRASNSTVRGLVINRFGSHGIWLQGGQGNAIEGNFIGTDPDGITALANGHSGVAVAFGAQFNRIGTNGDGIGLSWSVASTMIPSSPMPPTTALKSSCDLVTVSVSPLASRRVRRTIWWAKLPWCQASLPLTLAQIAPATLECDSVGLAAMYRFL